MNSRAVNSVKRSIPEGMISAKSRDVAGGVNPLVASGCYSVGKLNHKVGSRLKACQTETPGDTQSMNSRLRACKNMLQCIYYVNLKAWAIDKF